MANTRITVTEIQLDMSDRERIGLKTAQECAKYIKSIAPKNRGEYASDIGISKLKSGIDNIDFYVCNTGDTWPLGHLLEFETAVSNKYIKGSYSQDARPHYRPGFNRFKSEYVKRMQEIEIKTK